METQQLIASVVALCDRASACQAAAATVFKSCLDLKTEIRNRHVV